MSETKPFSISKHLVWRAYERVKENKGAAGLDDVSIQEFEECLKDNLYKIWNRMSSGSYLPPPVLFFDISKGDGEFRTLGIPTVGDRIAQMVVKLVIEPEVNWRFHPDSYAYRPFKCAHQALEVTRSRCWQYDWVVDLDVKSFFDTIDHELMMRAVRKHTDCPWILLYIERWLKVSGQHRNGVLVERTCGTPQGGVISPFLANLFVHYAVDDWMTRNFPAVRFARYADDIIVHCSSEAQARMLLERIRERLNECKLTLHPVKTKVVYCKDSSRGGSHDSVSFDFVSYTFRPRLAQNRKGKFFVAFSPAMSRKASKTVRGKIKEWQLHRKTTWSLEDIGELINPVVRGWNNYYGKYRKSMFHETLRYLEVALNRWARGKYKRFKGSRVKVGAWFRSIAKRDQSIIYHWDTCIKPSAGR
jgi:RNA-directed DNA polymerase